MTISRTVTPSRSMAASAASACALVVGADAVGRHLQRGAERRAGVAASAAGELALAAPGARRSHNRRTAAVRSRSAASPRSRTFARSRARPTGASSVVTGGAERAGQGRCAAEIKPFQHVRIMRNRDARSGSARIASRRHAAGCPPCPHLRRRRALQCPRPAREISERIVAVGDRYREAATPPSPTISTRPSARSSPPRRALEARVRRAG